MKYITQLLLLIALLLSPSLHASHIYGVDFYYTHVSGYTYKVNLVIYGDCSAFIAPTLSTATPEVQIYNGSIPHTLITLNIDTPASGVEVTPVCPAELSNTTCVNPSGTIPGIKKYTYSGIVTLPGASSLWRFVFTGNLVTSMAGRSNSITNVTMTGFGSVIQLIDTLNNTILPNNSAQYTTIPTPFYCINTASNFNPGAIDADGDVLSYGLVDGIDGSTATGLVNYLPPYSATTPIGATPGTFSFSSTTGQLAFTPNVTQKALVVYNVREIRSGVFMGNSQREMTVIVLSSCTNSPADANLSDATAGTISGGRQLNICRDIGPFSFNINPTDPEGDTIGMTVTGLPTGSSLIISGNNTPTPTAIFSWSTTGIAPGLYTFYVTYTGIACPLSATQTIAYSVHIAAPLICTSIVTENISCHGMGNGSISVIAAGGTIPYRYAINALPWQTSNTFTLLGPGLQYIHIIDTFGCTTDTNVLITDPPPLVATTALVHPTCEGYKDGAVSINVIGGTPPYQYSTDNVSFTTSNYFNELVEGTYTCYIKDSNGCNITITETLIGYPHISIVHSIAQPSCFAYSNGYINAVAAGGTAPFRYSINGSSTPSITGYFNNLISGVYTVTVTDSNNCYKNQNVFLPQPADIKIDFVITNNDCEGYGNTGALLASIIGGTTPYTYSWSNDPTLYSLNNNNLVNGPYSLVVTDSLGCTASNNATIEFSNCCTPYIPNAFTPNKDGKNDVLFLKHKGDMQLLGFSIFNRFGELVFYTTNQTMGWDGYYKGIPAELGVYYYQARIICGNKNDQVTILKGDITLIR